MGVVWTATARGCNANHAPAAIRTIAPAANQIHLRRRRVCTGASERSILSLERSSADTADKCDGGREGERLYRVAWAEAEAKPGKNVETLRAPGIALRDHAGIQQSRHVDAVPLRRRQRPHERDQTDRNDSGNHLPRDQIEHVDTVMPLEIFGSDRAGGPAES